MNKHLKYALLPLDATKKNKAIVINYNIWNKIKILEILFVAFTSMNSPGQCVPVW